MFEIEHLKCLITIFLLYLDFIYHIVVDINLLGMHENFKIFFGDRSHSLMNHPNQTKSLKHLKVPKYYDFFYQAHVYSPSLPLYERVRLHKV